MVLTFRVNKQQFYYRCRTPSSPRLHHDRQESITKGSMFYRKKADINRVYVALLEYFKKASIISIVNSVRISRPTVAQIAVDAQMLMHSDFVRYFGDYKLGDDERCDHIQIDESKFGKRKYNRGSRREGVWVFGMVEALRTGITYTYTDPSTGITQTREKYTTGRRMLCTVPNRTSATLLPILYRFCKRGSVIRSDGWRAYAALHPNDVRLQNNVFASANYSPDQFFFSRHEVVNHSVGFATRDQVRGNHTEGLINTNSIEGLWREVKAFVQPRHRTVAHCPSRLLEYLWRYENRSTGLTRGLQRCLREVSFDARDTAGSSEDFDWITRAEDGNSQASTGSVNGVAPPDVREPFQLQPGYDSDASSSEDDTDDEDWLPPTSRTGISAGLISSDEPAVVPENQVVRAVARGSSRVRRIATATRRSNRLH